MKILIASDIHGDAKRCEEIMARFEAERADRLFLLGDILYHGPRNDLPPGYAPKRVIEMLNSIAGKIDSVRGNCDAEVDGMVLAFDVLVESKDICINGFTLKLVHGHHHLDEQSFDGVDAVLYGHTHIPAKERRGGVWLLNPGSTSIPKEGSSFSYMTFNGRTFEWKKLPNGEVYDTLII